MPLRCTVLELQHSGFSQVREEKIKGTSCTLVSIQFVGISSCPRWYQEGESLRWLAETVVFIAPRCCLRPQTLWVAEERIVTEVKVAESAVPHL